MKVVLIDDDPTSVFLLQRLFQREGLPDALQAFLSPVEALAFLRQVPAGALPQVILLDLNMPVLSGWDVLEALKPLESQLLNRCLVYILTSSLAPTDVERSRHYPLVVGLLHKPFGQSEIQTIRARVLDTRPD